VGGDRARFESRLNIARIGRRRHVRTLDECGGRRGPGTQRRNEKHVCSGRLCSVRGGGGGGAVVTPKTRGEPQPKKRTQSLGDNFRPPQWGTLGEVKQGGEANKPRRRVRKHPKNQRRNWTGDLRERSKQVTTINTGKMKKKPQKYWGDVHATVWKN